MKIEIELKKRNYKLLSRQFLQEYLFIRFDQEENLLNLLFYALLAASKNSAKTSKSKQNETLSFLSTPPLFYGFEIKFPAKLYCPSSYISYIRLPDSNLV